MIIHTCFAYSDIKAEFHQFQDAFHVALKESKDDQIYLTLSYMQAKLLAESLQQVISQSPLTELMKTGSHLLGGMTASYFITAKQYEEK
ncbi:hypothetical protein SPFL3102_00599 [Sporomusaceae bacterium FL31]|nr:hypothetical protein SPFL3101_01352 [Sporomusaceae bacterium FL31]GCE32802.1 hypothetical protein SPFL3102_00599 [Sporomusaceae bacterium]